jgi:hypothetical protein
VKFFCSEKFSAEMEFRKIGPRLGSVAGANSSSWMVLELDPSAAGLARVLEAFRLLRRRIG